MAYSSKFINIFLELRELTIHGSSTRQGDLIQSRGSIDVISDDMLRQVVGKMKDLKYLHITVENNVSNLPQLVCNKSISVYINVFLF